ncbi:MAG: creatininase family protein [Trueperaceae bacterium]
MRTNELARMSWPEAGEAFRQDPVVLIPMGTIEQHGPHLPMAADTIVAETVALAAASSTASVLTPAIPFGYCANSRNFPGTVTLPSQLLAELVQHTIGSLAQHGARRFILVNNHRSNAAAVQHGAYELRSRRDLLIGSFFPWGTMIAIARQRFPDLGEAIGHGGEPESSVMAHLRPRDIGTVADGTARSYSDFQGLPMKSASETFIDGHVVNLFRDLDELTPSGVNGDPTQGDADRGAELLERTTQVLVSFIEKFAALNLRQA